MINTSLDKAILDAYCITIDKAPEDVLPKLHRLFNAEVSPAKPLFGYDYALDFHTEDKELLAKVLYGGQNTGVHVRLQGFYTRTLAELLRTHFPEHSVSRIDGALDISSPGIYDEVCKIAIALAHRKNMTISQVGDWTRPEGKGRTLYLGSRESQVMLRIYEKGKQKGTDPNWVRIEAEVKPSKAEAKLKAATMTASDCLRASKFSRELLQELSGLTLTPCSLAEAKPYSSLENRVFHFVKQYGQTLEELNSLAGLQGALEYILSVQELVRKGASNDHIKAMLSAQLSPLQPASYELRADPRQYELDLA